MKILVGLFLGLCLCGTLLAEITVERVGDLDTKTTQDPGGYRGAKWGMTEAEVKNSIPNVKWEKIFGVLLFRDKIFNYDTTAKFYFKVERLERVEMVMSPEVSVFESRGPKIISVFNSLCKNLTQKYGEPDGHSANIATWSFPSTEISLSIHYELNTAAWVEMVYYKRGIRETAPSDIEKL